MKKKLGRSIAVYGVFFANPKKPISRHLILDVGANNGRDGLRLAKANPSRHVIAFEPVPEMIEEIHRTFSSFSLHNDPLRNYSLIKCAVADYNGESTFNVAGQADWGCSSLLAFNSDLEQTWPGRTDFKVSHQISVKVTRLDSFFEQIDFSAIDWLHCDTQGADLAVLRGLGDYRTKCAQGRIEVATTKRVALYKAQHTLEDVYFDFARWGWEVTSIRPNDEFFNEVNIFFRNKIANFTV